MKGMGSRPRIRFEINKSSGKSGSWQQYVDGAKEIGFDKVCIIARANFTTLANSGPQDIATYWPAIDGFYLNKDKLNKVVDCISRKWMKDQYIPEIISWIKVYYDRLCFVNENQEILDDWRHPTKTSFNFFGEKQSVEFLSSPLGRRLAEGRIRSVSTLKVSLNFVL